VDTPAGILNKTQDKQLREIAEKVLAGKRIIAEECLCLYEKAELSFLGILAEIVMQRHSGNLVFFNRNIHIEPTNICIYQCRFCAYSRKKGDKGSWEYTPEEMVDIIRSHVSKKITEVHIVGGVHPDWDMEYYLDLLRLVKKEFPSLHIKGFTAVELDSMICKSGLTYEEGLKKLKAAGLDSIPGGGAEIFDPSVRKQLCNEKSTAEKWLAVHKAAHKAGLPSNATMLYGHLETYRQRVDHMARLRSLQDETNGFNAFIPLKFRKENNQFSHLSEITNLEDLRNYAVCRIFLDNFPHIKAYWPMIGKDIAQLAISFGADDLDGTIDDTTKIYTMAGVKDSRTMSADEMIGMIKRAGKIPAERDSLYNEISRF